MRIIPTRQGLFYFLINFIVFIIGLTYVHNVILLVSFFMFSFFILTMITSHANFKKNLKMNLTLESSFTGEEVKCLGLNHGYTTLPLFHKKRGKYKIEKLRILSTEPYHFFQCYTNLTGPYSYSTYPELYKEEEIKKILNKYLTSKQSGDEFDSFRSFKIGDSLKRIHRKKFSIDGSLLTKNFQNEQKEIFIKSSDYHYPLEEKLKILTSIIVYLDRGKKTWVLDIEGRTFTKLKHALEFMSEYNE